MRLRNALLLGSALALGAAAPAAAAEVEVKGTDALVWDKPEVRILPGDSVVWSFDGTTQAHNVLSDSPNWSFRSTLAVPAPRSEPAVFTTPGTYRFVCEVHRDTMFGHVIVGDAPPPPPPPPGQQPFPNDSPEPGALETGGLDRTRPTLRAVHVQRMRRGARIRFRVSERSLVTVRFKRGGKTVTTRRISASGSARLTVRGKQLRAGRYRVELRAEDVAGNRSGVRSARVTRT